MIHIDFKELMNLSNVIVILKNFSENYKIRIKYPCKKKVFVVKKGANDCQQ